MINLTRLLVLSDTHKDKYNLNKVIEGEQNVDGVVFLGDGMSEIDDAFINSDKPLYLVAGNCDTDYYISSERVIEFENVRVFITHGHFYDVKLTLKNVVEVAKQKGCEYAFIGHTHEQADEIVDGVRVINPGSVSFFAHYAVVTVDKDKLDVELKGVGNPYENLLYV